ncbi:MAG TPA: hypothetical protein VGS57_08860 [Thermoanaerobaculia bacterium]|nr:hypothetical protein [Thermoanaerobaculia bacterium]
MTVPTIEGVWRAKPRTGAAVAIAGLMTLVGYALLAMLAAPDAAKLLGGREGLVRPLRVALPLVLLAVWVLVLMRHEARRAAAALAIGSGCFLVYAHLLLPATDNVVAARGCVEAATALIRYGPTTAAPAPPSTPSDSASGSAPASGPVSPAGGMFVAPRCPVAEAAAMAPLGWIADGLVTRAKPPAQRRERLVDAVADVCAAVAVALLYIAARRLGADARLATAGALILGLCTPHLSLHAGGLWTHNVSGTLILAALVLALPNGSDPSTAASAWSGALTALAAATRPTALVLAVLPLLVVGARRRFALLPWLLAFGGVLGVAMTASRAAFGTLLPHDPDFHLVAFALGPWARAAGALLLSPNRGLLFVTPVFLFSLAGAALGIARSDGWKRLFYVAAAICCAALLALAGATDRWWDGAGFGPRVLADLFPLLALLLLPAVQWLLGAPSWSRIAGSGLLVMAIAASAFTAWRGATAPGTREWNVKPPASQERAWDWSDIQALRQPGHPRGL